MRAQHRAHGRRAPTDARCRAGRPGRRSPTTAATHQDHPEVAPRYAVRVAGTRPARKVPGITPEGGEGERPQQRRVHTRAGGRGATTARARAGQAPTITSATTSGSRSSGPGRRRLAWARRATRSAGWAVDARRTAGPRCASGIGLAERRGSWAPRRPGTRSRPGGCWPTAACPPSTSGVCSAATPSPPGRATRATRPAPRRSRGRPGRGARRAGRRSLWSASARSAPAPGWGVARQP